MDKVFIEGLEIRTVIGIYDWEREIRQVVRLDLEMDWDISKAAISDDIADALDYKAVSKRLIAFVEESSFGLIESLAERCAQIILNEFSVSRLRLKMSKPGAVRGSENVAILIERQQEA
ncbi:MAG: dihydroneopterin aldolase [Mariprofundaceae bacterium]